MNDLDRKRSSSEEENRAEKHARLTQQPQPQQPKSGYNDAKPLLLKPHPQFFTPTQISSDLNLMVYKYLRKSIIDANLKMKKMEKESRFIGSSIEV